MAAAAATVEQPSIPTTTTSTISFADALAPHPAPAPRAADDAAAGATALYEALAAQGGDNGPWTSATHRAESLAWRRAFQPARLAVADVAHGLREYGIGQHGTTRAGEPILWCERFGRAQLPDREPEAPHNQQQQQQQQQREQHEQGEEEHECWGGKTLQEMPFWCAARLTYLAMVYALEHSLGPGRRRVAIVINCAGMSRRTVDERMTRILTDTTTVGYPDCLGAVVLYNAPRWTVLAWRTLGHFVPRYWRERLHITAAAPTALLRRLADAAQLPHRFGGTADDALSTAEHYIAVRRAAEITTTIAPTPLETSLAARERAAALYSATLFWIAVCRDARAAGPGGVVRAAWLKKQGGVVPLWRKYHFALQGHALLYRNDPRDAVPNNAVDLRRAAVCRGDELPPARRARLSGAPACVLVIDTPQRTFTLLCASEAERNAWAQAALICARSDREATS